MLTIIIAMNYTNHSHNCNNHDNNSVGNDDLNNIIKIILINNCINNNDTNELV